MKRIDDETREAIAQLSLEFEDEGYEVNRRALAREFGVSPQTIARILDGPSARRGADHEDKAGVVGSAGVLAAIGMAVVIVWLSSRGRRG